jgi:GH15 family glucan-1,4-alpha-glucosidase
MTALGIADYGLIGDLHTAALVGRNGSIDWCCAPRFDSPSVFAALLDPARGGRWRISPAGSWTSAQRYLPATNILETVFHLTGGVAHLIDFMPVGPARGASTEIHRRIHCPRGSVALDVVFEPRFDYARRRPWLAARRCGVVATDRFEQSLTVASGGDVAWHVDGERATAHLRLEEGHDAWFVLRFDDDDVHPVDDYEPQRRLETTARWWDSWLSQSRYRGAFRLEVERSALALKLCCYEPTGAIIAAPTSSLPESPGGTRNWDYRYVWLRDAAFVLKALDALGFSHEADRFLHFLRRIGRRGSDRHVQVMYTVDGHREMPELILDHLAGFGGASPVRIGNAAVEQFQLDVYGEVLETADAWRRARTLSEGTWQVLRHLVEDCAARWREPDQSIWEPRDQPRQYVYSKVMSWVALDRGARMAAALGHAADAARWSAEADTVRAEVLSRGWDAGRGTFVQSYGAPYVDAALLVMPLVGFLPPSDARVRGTLSAVRAELRTSCEELIYRYRAPDGITDRAGTGEGAFLFCSFWMIQNLALAGERAEAERLFRNLLRRASPLGLLAEQIDPASGLQLGNFPQALSHAALISTALIVDRQGPAA